MLRTMDLLLFKVCILRIETVLSLLVCITRRVMWYMSLEVKSTTITVEHQSIKRVIRSSAHYIVLDRCGSVVVGTSACHAGGRGSLPGTGALLGVITWLSTLEIVSLCVFRMRH